MLPARLYLLNLFVMLPVFMNGCNRTAVVPNYTEPPVTFILADVSGSIRSQTRASYAEYLTASVVPKLAPGERIVLSPVGDSSAGIDPTQLLETQLPAYPDQPQHGWNHNLAQEAHACSAHFSGQAAAFASASRELDQTLVARLHAPAKENKTYLLDGVQMAARMLGEYHGRPTLIVLTDGIEDSDGQPALHFGHAGFWKPDRIRWLLSTLRQQGRMPQLAGAAIYFVGAPGTSHETAESLRNFWFAYFEAAGVAAEDIHFGPRPRFRPASTPAASDAKTYCHTVQ